MADLAGRRLALLPAAARIPWRPVGILPGPVLVRRLVAEKVVEARLAIPLP